MGAIPLMRAVKTPPLGPRRMGSDGGCQVLQTVSTKTTAFDVISGVVGGVLVALVGADPRIDADGLQRADLARPHPNEARIQTARPVVTA